jgi:hypothetical protein
VSEDRVKLYPTKCQRCGCTDWIVVDGARGPVNVGQPHGFVLCQQAYCQRCKTPAQIPLTTPQCPRCGYAELVTANPQGMSHDGPQTSAQARAQAAPEAVQGDLNSMAKAMGLGGVL